MKIKASFSRLLYEKEGYVIALFHAREHLLSPIGQEMKYFPAKGMNLPTQKGANYSFCGSWTFDEKDGKRRYTFEVESFEMVLPTNASGIIKFLQTLDGVGRVTAKRIYEAFGDEVFDVLDNDIEKVKEVKGIRKGTFQKLKMSWTQKSIGRDLFAYLYKFNVKDSVIMNIFDTYEEFSMHIVRNHPYALTEFVGFGFKTADAIAKDNAPNDDFSYLYSSERISAGILEVMKEYEHGGRFINAYNRKFKEDIQTGNTCIKWSLLYRLSIELLQIDYSQEAMAKVILNHMGKTVFIDEDDHEETWFLRAETAKRELGIAKNVQRLMNNTEALSYHQSMTNIERMLDKAVDEGVLFARLSDEQKAAVEKSLNNQLSIITGGPGTGKTSIQKGILYVVNKIAPSSEVLLVAPTGRAARRMSESTGYPAQTIHSALGLFQGSEDYQVGVDPINADLVIVDEASMIDTHLGNCLLSAISDRSRVIIVGDEQQLPSVGPGSVLRELIASGVIPTSVLTKVFRQAKGSSIGYNAKRIIAGNTNVLEDDSFRIVEARGTEAIANEVKRLYAEEIQNNDVSDVSVLSPFKRKTETGVNQLNDALQKIVFPNQDREAMSFITGDKVMYTKNANGLTNGDIGIITKIKSEADGVSITADFSGRIVTLEDDDLTSLELAYATTVHKSQGSEYEVVILVMDPAHSLMLRTCLIYTAVTRAKRKIYIVGARESYLASIRGENGPNGNGGSELRFSRLADFVARRFSDDSEETSEEEQLVLSL